MERQYYSVRTGRYIAGAKVDLELAKELFNAIYGQLREKGYFDESFGYTCVDAGDVPGKLGGDVPLYFFRKLRKKGLWPISLGIQKYSQDDLFDVIELLFDLVSFPVDGFHHTYADCGWHYDKFDREKGRLEYREQVNELLRDFAPGYTINEKAEILELASPEVERLLNAKLPASSSRLQSDIDAAADLMRRRNASLADRKNAVRMPAGVLESLRPQMKAVITANDEGDVFNIANNFGIRHKNEKQKTDYDPLWLSWMFHYYLATVQLITRKLVYCVMQMGSYDVRL
jgi:hypothetical protein